MAASAIAPILPLVVEQHAEEAAFLWLLRDAAADGPHYAARHLARLDGRIDAHLDGLSVAGDPGFEIALAQLDRFPEPGEAFAAAAIALASGLPERLAPVLEVVRAMPEAERGLRAALGWTPPPRLGGQVRGWLDSDDPLERLLAVTACSLHRIDPSWHLSRLLRDPEPRVRARALRLAGEIGRTDLADAVAAAIGAPDDAGFWAAWSAGLLGRADPALPSLVAAAEAGGPRAVTALEIAVPLMGSSQAAGWVRRLNGDPAARPLVVRAIGRLGDPAGIPWLAARMAEPDLARRAGESLALITGVDLAFEDLDGAAPADDDAGPSDERTDERIALDPDEGLPWPDPVLVGAWWERNAARFPPGMRHLLGRPLDAGAAAAAFGHGYQRQRRAAAYESALLRPGSGLPNWRRVVRGVRPMTDSGS